MITYEEFEKASKIVRDYLRQISEHIPNEQKAGTISIGAATNKYNPDARTMSMIRDICFIHFKDTGWYNVKLKDFASIDSAVLLLHNGCGPKTIERINNFLSNYGLSLSTKRAK